MATLLPLDLAIHIVLVCGYGIRLNRTSGNLETDIHHTFLLQNPQYLSDFPSVTYRSLPKAAMGAYPWAEMEASLRKRPTPAGAVRIFDAKTLLRAPFLPMLVDMINECYTAKFQQFFPDPWLGKKRFNSLGELAADISPGGFTVVTFASADPEMPIATISVKLYSDVEFWDEGTVAERLEETATTNCWRPEPGLQENVPADSAWELTGQAVSTAPEHANAGLAEEVTHFAMCEIRRRLLDSTAENATRQCNVICKVIKEMWGDSIIRYGFTVVREREIPKGTWGSLEPRHSWDAEWTIGRKTVSAARARPQLRSYL